MSCYCINPLCEQRENPDNTDICLSCEKSLLINNRIRLLKPLRKLSENPFTYNEIFEVEDAGTENIPVPKRRVMKIIRWTSSKAVQLIEREALALSLIDHPNIPQTNGSEDFFTYCLENSPFVLRCLVMDKIEGQDLEKWISSHQPISQPVALDWLKQLVKILDVIHHSGFFHRDIKPANIILQPNGQLALIDFGAARQITDTYLVKIGASGGANRNAGNNEITAIISHFYTPLEQIYGRAVPQSDFYALGRSFVRLMTGVHLMDLPTNRHTERLIWRNKALQIDKPLADIVDSLMAPFPSQRPMSTQAILQRLEKLPRQSKIHKITTSKKFIFGVTITTTSLLGWGIYKIILPVLANNLVIEGQKLESTNNSERAQTLFAKAMKISPEMSLQISRFYFERAAVFQDDLSLQRKYYNLAIKYNPKDGKSYNNLAFTCQLMEDEDCTLKAYQELFNIEPKAWEGHYNLGNFYESKNKYNLAEEQYKLAIKYSNDTATNAVNNLSRLKILQQRYSEAAQLAMEGLKKTPASNQKWRAALYKNLGWARLMQKDYKEAEKNLQKAFELDSRRVDTYCLLAKTKEALGDLDAAKSYGEICLLARDEVFLPEIQKWRAELIKRIYRKN